MIDYTKWDSGDCLANGVLTRPMPESQRPPDAKLTAIREDIGSNDEFREGLLKGGIEAFMYYGCWSIWKDGGTYSGELFQYRNVTDRLDKVSLDTAVQRAREWFDVSYG